MRAKDDILDSVVKEEQEASRYDGFSDARKQAELEVLLDIRDVFVDTRKVLCGIYDHLVMDK